MGRAGDSPGDAEHPASISLRIEQEIFASAAADKSTRTFTTAAAVKTWADRHVGGNPGAIRAAAEFALEAIGIEGRGYRLTGAATHADHYRKFVEDRVREILGLFTQRLYRSRLSNFWESRQTRDLRVLPRHKTRLSQLKMYADSHGGGFAFGNLDAHNFNSPLPRGTAPRSCQWIVISREGRAFWPGRRLLFRVRRACAPSSEVSENTGRTFWKGTP